MSGRPQDRGRPFAFGRPTSRLRFDTIAPARRDLAQPVREPRPTNDTAERGVSERRLIVRVVSALDHAELTVVAQGVEIDAHEALLQQELGRCPTVGPGVGSTGPIQRGEGARE